MISPPGYPDPGGPRFTGILFGICWYLLPSTEIPGCVVYRKYGGFDQSGFGRIHCKIPQGVCNSGKHFVVFSVSHQEVRDLWNRRPHFRYRFVWMVYSFSLCDQDPWPRLSW